MPNTWRRKLHHWSNAQPSRREPWRCPPGSGGALTEGVSHPAQQLSVRNRTGVFCVRGYLNRSPGMPHKWKTWGKLQVSKLLRRECWSKFCWLHSPGTVPDQLPFPAEWPRAHPYLVILCMCVFMSVICSGMYTHVHECMWIPEVNLCASESVFLFVF